MTYVMLNLRYKTSFKISKLNLQPNSTTSKRSRAPSNNSKIRNLQTLLDMDKSIPVLVTFLKDKRYFYNWCCHVQDMLIEGRMIIFTTEDLFLDNIDSFEYLKRISVPFSVVSLKEDLGHELNRSSTFELKHLKRILRFILDLLQRNHTVLFFKLKTIWLQNPLNLIQKLEIEDSVIDLYSAGFTNRRSTIDTNFLYLKPSNNLIRLWSKFVQEIENRLTSRVNNPFSYLAQLLYRRYAGVLYQLLPLRQIQDSAWYNSLTLQKRHVRELHIIRFYANTSALGVEFKSLGKYGHWFIRKDFTCDYDNVVNAEKSVWGLQT